MKTATIALISAIGLSTIAIAQTTPQTTPDNNTLAGDNVTTAPAPDAAQTPQAPTPTVPETDSATDPATPDSTTATPESAPAPERR